MGLIAKPLINSNTVRALLFSQNKTSLHKDVVGNMHNYLSFCSWL